jgi:hypothetical protein
MQRWTPIKIVGFALVVTTLVGLSLGYVVRSDSLSGLMGDHGFQQDSNQGVIQSNEQNYGLNGWTFNILGSIVANVTITQGIQQAVFLTLFDNCLVYDYNPTMTTYSLGIYNLTSHAQSVPITIQTPNDDGPIGMLVEGPTLYFGYGSFASGIAGGQVFSTNNLENYTLLHTWSSGFQPESIGYYTPRGSLLVSGAGGPNTGIVYELTGSTATEIESDPKTGDATFLAMFNSTMVVAGGTFPQTPIFSNNLINWTSDDVQGIGKYDIPYVMPWSWATELIYGKIWMPVARFTEVYPDQSGLASFGGGIRNTSYNSYLSQADSYYSIADGLVGGTMGLTLGSETSFPGPAIIQQFNSTGAIGSPIFKYDLGGNWSVSSMVYDPAQNYVYGALLGQSQKEIILLEGNNGTSIG